MAWVASAAKAVSVVSSLATAGHAIYSGIQAKKEGKESAERAQRLADANAAKTEAETAEAARRMEQQQEQDVALAKARAFASGVKLTGSPQGHIGGLRKNYADELEWLKTSGAEKARLERVSGQNIYDTQIASTEGDALSGVFKGIGGVGDAASKWFLT